MYLLHWNRSVRCHFVTETTSYVHYTVMFQRPDQLKRNCCFSQTDAALVFATVTEPVGSLTFVHLSTELYVEFVSMTVLIKYLLSNTVVMAL